MRVLILSCNTGEGHNSAARAIAEILEQRKIEYKIEDALSCFSKRISELVSKGHIMIYKKAPKVFGAGYRLIENHQPEHGEKSAMFELLEKGGSKLKDVITDGNYTAVISVHVFAAIMVTKVMEDHALPIKSYFIPTDYTCYPGVPECKPDKMFVPHESLIPEFIADGVPAEMLVPCRIPVRQEFFEKVAKSIARKQLGLPQNKTIVLLACGSMGCGPIKNLAEQLLKECSPDTGLVVICGNNKKLYGKISELAENNYDIQVVGFTAEMSLYMDAADMIVTKPGGLSSTEAATKGLPMIFVNAVPGCETYNLSFYTNHGYGETADSIEGLVQLVKKYTDSPEARAALSARLNKDFLVNGAEIICDHVIQDCSSTASNVG